MMAASSLNEVSNPGVAPRPWLAAATLCQREMIRFFRQKNRVFGAIGQPLVFWLLFSAGFDRSFRLDDANESAGGSFQAYYFPGTLVLILMFTAIFATISIIEDRREGFLQSVLVAPIPRWSMVLGKVLGGALIAMIQGMVFLLVALLIPISLTPMKLMMLTGMMFVSAIALTSLGVLIAWRMDSTQGFHAIMSVFLMPMWLMSGAFFPIPPIDAESSWAAIGMHWLMKCNPLSYSVAGIHRILFDGSLSPELFVPSATVCWSVTIGFAIVMFIGATIVSSGRTRGDLL